MSTISKKGLEWSSASTDLGIYRKSVGTLTINNVNDIVVNFLLLTITPDIFSKQHDNLSTIVHGFKWNFTYHNGLFKKNTFTIKKGSIVPADAHLYGIPIPCTVCENNISEKLLFLLVVEKGETKSYFAGRYEFCSDTCVNLFCLNHNISYESISVEDNVDGLS